MSFAADVLSGESRVAAIRCRSAEALRHPRSGLRDQLSTSVMKIRIRLAEASDIPALRELIEASVRGLQAGDYSAAQLESALRTVYGVDTQLISDGTYFAAEEIAASGTALLVGCGGWSKGKTLFGGAQVAGGEESLVEPAREAA